MPIFLEPDQTFPIVLDSDMSKPEESRPTFYARSQSMRGHQKIIEMLRLRKDDERTAEQIFQEIVAKLTEVIVSWNNMGGVEFGKDAFYDILTYHEARELLQKVAYNHHVQPEEKKS